MRLQISSREKFFLVVNPDGLQSVSVFYPYSLSFAIRERSCADMYRVRF